MLHVLYIDDEPDLLDIGKSFLEANGEFAIDTATSPGRGLEMLEMTRYDAVICDYQMPDMDGISVLKTLRSSGNGIPFILFTGRGKEEVVIQAINNGADFYLQKGGEPETLFIEMAHMIQQVVGKRRAEEQIREMNVYLTNLITYAGNPIVTWDVHSKITRFNQAFEKLTGFSEMNVLGHDFDILFPDETRGRSLDLICRALFGEKWEGVEIPIRTIHGEVRTVIWNSANIYAGDGITLVATLAMGTDITERKKAETNLKAAYEEVAATEEELRQQYEQLGGQERTLRNNQERLNSILRSTPTGIGLLKGQVIIEANDQLCEMTGYSRGELIGTDVRAIWADNDEFIRIAERNHTNAHHQKSGALETTWRRKDGAVITVILSSALLDPEDPSEGMTLTALDITTRVMAEDALHMANKKLNLLSSVTRHDILNKIAIVETTLALLRRRDLSPDITGLLGKIATATKAIQSQIEFTRVYKDLGSAEARWQSLPHIVSGMPVPDTIRFHADLDGIEVYADPLFERVFFNLLDNTLRHGGNVQEIRVSFRESGTGLICTWEDDGVGIPAGEKERIFERGYGKNTGLGLFLAEEILAITGIGISETGEPGTGARFELSIPKGGYRFIKDPTTGSPLQSG